MKILNNLLKISIWKLRMSDDFENLAIGNHKLAENEVDAAMYHYHAILKDNKDHIKLYLTNFDLFCRNEIKNYNFLR